MIGSCDTLVQGQNNANVCEDGEEVVSSRLHAFVTGGAKLQLSYEGIEGQPFSTVIRADIQQLGRTPWDIQLQERNSKLIKQSDVLLATFYFRTQQPHEEGDDGEVEFVFELARNPWTKSIQHPVRSGPEWKKIYIPFVAAQDFSIGEAQASLRLGYKTQIVEFGNLIVTNFQQKLALADLPKTRISYSGISPDAPWRKQAEERINKIRKSTLWITVVDSAGAPVQGAAVHVKLVKHAFGFGTCVPSAILVSDCNVEYKNICSELFNIATLENDLKWPVLCGDWGPDYTLDRAKQGIKWLQEKGLCVRGHVLVWPSWQYLPHYLRQHANDPSKLRQEVQHHVHELTTTMKGSVTHWDVVNEPFDNRDLLDILGSEVMVDWFNEARAADPDVKLFINDYDILSGGGNQSQHRDHYEETIQMLIDKGAPLDGIGMQGHFGSLLTGIDDMFRILDRYAKFEKPIWVTEYDVVIDDEEICGKFTQDFYTAMFSHPAVEGIVMWGFWDGAHHKNNGTMYRWDWSLKSAGKAFRELLQQTWHTDTCGLTNDDGVFTTHGFFGEYSIEIKAAGKTKEIRAQLVKGHTCHCGKLKGSNMAHSE